MEVLHLNYFDAYKQVYCERKQQVVLFDEAHHQNYCAVCSYFAGSLQGDGVECQYEDSTAPKGEDLVVVSSPYEFQEKRLKAIPIEIEKQSTKFVVGK